MTKRLGRCAVCAAWRLAGGAAQFVQKPMLAGFGAYLNAAVKHSDTHPASARFCLHSMAGCECASLYFRGKLMKTKGAFAAFLSAAGSWMRCHGKGMHAA
jgi:hypothetical protein